MSLPPGPRAPALVQSVTFGRRPLDTLARWHRRYGNVFTVRFVGFGTGVYVADPDAIRELFTGDQSDLLAGEANSFLEPVLGESSVLVLDGPEHLRQRRLLAAPFHGARVAAFRDSIAEVARREVERWRPGERIVLRERMRALTFEVICRAVFGVTEEARVERLRRALCAVIDSTSLLMAFPALHADLGPLSPGGRLARRLRVADGLLYEEIALRRGAADLAERGDVLSLLMTARDESGAAMSDRELRDELFTMLGAGHETTATELAFAFELLLRHPPVLARLRDSVVAGDDAYLDAVVKETFRLRPVIDATQRTLTRPREVAGWELPAGIRVYPAIAVVHHRGDIYPDPEAFRPERHLDGEGDGEGAGSYTWLPFGGGIRRCVGAALAQMEMREVLRLVAARVHMRPARRAPDPVVLKGVTVAPRHGVPVIVERVDRPAGAMAAAPREPAAAARAAGGP